MLLEKEIFFCICISLILVLSTQNYLIKADINIINPHEQLTPKQQERPKGIKRKQPMFKYLILISHSMESDIYTHICIYTYISFYVYVIYVFHIIAGNHSKFPMLSTSALFSQHQV